MSLITYMTRIHFADHVLEDALEAELGHLRVTRPLVVTDCRDAAGRRARLTAAIPGHARAVVFDHVGAEARETDCLAAAAIYAAARCDGVIGFGGAAALDVAKALALAGAEAPALERLLDAGSGAGVSRSARILRADGRRVTLTGPGMIPAAALCDPTLALGEAPEATAAAGMDALTHCLEAYLGAAWNPPADGIALEGLRRAAAHLERCVADGDNLDSRRELLAAALNGALAEEKGLGGVHALAHALEEAPGPRAARHGSLHPALLAQVLEFNAPAVGRRYRAIKQAMRLPASADLPTAILRLGSRLALPDRLGALRLEARALDRIAQRAEADPANRTNPRLANAGDYRAMLEAAL